MNGIVLGLVRETLRGEYGGDVWVSILAMGRGGRDAGGVSGDGAPAVAVDLPSDALVCWFGRKAVSLLRERHPRIFDRHPDLGGFLRSLAGGGEASPSAAADAGMPALTSHPAPDGGTLITVEGRGRGSRACALLKGLVAEAARHYGQEVDLRELKCAGHGDNRCLLHVSPVVSAATPMREERRSTPRRAAGLA